MALFNEKKFRESLPPEMLKEKRWVRYFLSPKPEGGTAKIPLGSHSDPATWDTFENCVAKLENDQQGLGYNFLGGQIHGLDIDHCRNPKTRQICNEAMLLLSRIPSWAEFSVSGQGMHVLFVGNVRGKQLGETCLQYWHPAKAPRFFAITCDMVGEAFTGLKDIGDDFNFVFAQARHISAKIREELEKVDREQWLALPAERKTEEVVDREKSKTKAPTVKGFDVHDFLSFYNLPIDHEEDKPKYGHCIFLTTCPIKGSPHVGQNSTTTNFMVKSGGLAFHCQSTGCQDSSVYDAVKKLAEDHGPYPKQIFAEKPAVDFLSDGDLTNAFVASNPPLKYATDEQSWFGYRDGVWRPRENARPEIETFLRSIEPTDIANPKLADAIHRRLTSTRAIQSVSYLAEARPQMEIRAQDFDPDPMLLGLPDGEVLDLRTAERRAATPSDLITKALPVAPSGTCPRWLEYLEQVHPGDPELIAYLQRWAGYCLTSLTVEDMILFLIGVGGSGKGTFVEPLQKAMDDYCVSIPIGMLLESTDEDRRLNYIARLRGARLAVCNEGSKMRRLDSRGIKMLTGGGWLAGRAMAQNPITFRATHKIVVLANDNPVLDLDSGMKQRVHVVPFTQKFRGEQREEKGLRDFFAQPEQLKGIFAWMVEGCLAYQKEGLKPPKSVTETTEQYFEDADLLEQFLKDHTSDKTGIFTPTGQLWPRWVTYCQRAGLPDEVGSQRTFIPAILEKRSKVKQGKQAGSKGLWNIELIEYTPKLEERNQGEDKFQGSSL
jgi:P4 family phage/plasmid primase-like protien